jgi:hypothetical protein
MKSAKALSRKSPANYSQLLNLGPARKNNLAVWTALAGALLRCLPFA